MIRQFKKTLLTYESNALVQNDMAESLITLLKNKTGIAYNRTLEIGCGTGLLTKKIINDFAINELFLNDIIDKYDTLIQKRVHKNFIIVQGDIEELSNIPDNLDLIISNATFQWIDDQPALISKLETKLNNNGILAFTSFGRDHFNEIKALTNIGLDYIDCDFYKTLNKYELIHCSTETTQLWFPDPVSVLHHIKFSGVNGIETPKWTKGKLDAFCKSYIKRFNTLKGVPLTYNPTFIILKKKAV